MAGSSGMANGETCIKITQISTSSVCVCVCACACACAYMSMCVRVCVHVCTRLGAAGVCNFMHRKCLCIQSS